MKTRVAGATMSLLLMIEALGGCGTGRLTFEKPGVAAADVQRDQNECVLAAMEDGSGVLLTIPVDRDALIRCMEARGYTVGSK